MSQVQTSSSNLYAASEQWWTRPDDQRFVSLADLKQAVAKRRDESWTATPYVNELRVIPTGEPNSQGERRGLGVEVFDPTVGERRMLTPSHWSFNQLAQFAGAPAAYMRKLPADLAAINLQYGLERIAMRDDALVLAQSNGEHSLRAITSTSYGRIWDKQVVEAVERVNVDGRWKVPAASYATSNPKRATTLYASDRDVFIFLVDDSHPVEIPGEKHPLYRGFYTWNSEVGSAVFGLCTFLYRYVCDNRIIWGATDVRELRIRHTGGAPERFAHEGAKYLKRYSEESAKGVVEQVTRAKAKELPEAKEKDGIATWLQKRGFTKAAATASVEAAVAEEGQARSLWDIVNGVTAYARTIPHANDRADLEAKAGKIMELATA